MEKSDIGQASRQISLEGLKNKVADIKLRMLELYKMANAGHIGASLSCIDLMIYFMLYKMREQDIFILSKGHAAAALYCVLNAKGTISDEELQTFYKDGTRLAAHPSAYGADDILFSTGSLGQGPSLSCGLALGAKFKNQDQHIYCLISDGECNEGSVWEAAMFAAHNKLENITFILDKNNVQAFGYTKDVINMDNMPDRWKVFGWQVVECNGHDFISINDAVNKLKSLDKDSPKCLIAHTIKGNGVSFMQNTIDWHYLPMNDEQYKIAVSEIKGSIEE